MGFDIKDNTVFLEFYGLPGCGKSTISHMVAVELRKRGNKVIEPTYDTDNRYNPIVRKGIKLLKLIRYVMFNPKKYNALSTLIRKNGYSGTELLSQAVNIAPKLWEYDRARVDYAIFDEGLTQSAISLVINEGSSLDNERVLYNLCRKRAVKKIYIKVSPEIALLRMARRDKHDSRIEKVMGEIKRGEALLKIEMLCDDICPELLIKEASIQSAVECILQQIG